MGTVVSRKATKRVAGTAGAAVAGGSVLVGLSRVAPLSLAVLGATLIVLALVLVVAGYKMLDRLLQHIERRPRDSFEHLEQRPGRLRM
jgi:membrane protein implicated in regulation of membrane protease activity